MIRFYSDGIEIFPVDNFSVDIIRENRLFSENKAYTLDIDFPLGACAGNKRVFGHIDRADVHISTLYVDCEVICTHFSMKGSLAVLEVSGGVVKTQFLEGRRPKERKPASETNYLCKLDLGKYPYEKSTALTPRAALTGTPDECCMPWVAEGYDIVNNCVTWDYSASQYVWHKETERLSWQPRLRTIMRRAALACGYTLDISRLQPQWADAFICNSLPGSWIKPDYKDAMPAWTLKEFFSYLGPFLGGSFLIDESAMTINYTPYEDNLNHPAIVVVGDVDDGFSTEVTDDEDEDTDFIPAKRYRYRHTDNPVWKFYDCPGIIEGHPDFDTYETFEDIADVKFQYTPDGHRYGGTDANQLKYVKDIDTFFTARTVNLYTNGHSAKSFANLYKYMQQTIYFPVNNLGPSSWDPDGGKSYVEMNVSPVTVDFALEGPVMFLPLGSYSDGHAASSAPGITSIGPGTPEAHRYSRILFSNEILTGNDHRGLEMTIQNYTEDRPTNDNYDSLYIGFAHWDARFGPWPQNDVAADDSLKWSRRPMRLRDRVASESEEIDPKVKYTFSFHLPGTPDICSRFIIHGQPYVCRKLTETFTARGRSPLLKGEFHRILKVDR